MNGKAIELEHLSYTFPDGTEALRDVSFYVERGEKSVIIGPNGAGKSTLLLHLNGLLRGQGAVRILGQLIDRNNLKKIRAEVGLVFQNPDDQLFLPTPFDDVAYGLFNLSADREEIAGKVRRILGELEVEHLAGKPSVHLSPGEKKRMSLATVLVLEPEILVLDEPSSDLDPGSRRWLVDYLKKRDATMLLATHDLDLAWEIGQKIILMNKGRVVAEGTKSQILGDRALLEQNHLELPLSYMLNKGGRHT